MGEELHHSLDDIAESEPEFTSRSEVDRAMADLLAGWRKPARDIRGWKAGGCS